MPVRRPLQIEEENAALLAALTDSLDGMVDAEVGGLSVFPTLGEGPNQEEEDDDAVLPLNTGDFSQSLGTETEDPSLVGSAPTSLPVWLVAGCRTRWRGCNPWLLFFLFFLFQSLILLLLNLLASSWQLRFEGGSVLKGMSFP